MIVPSIHEERHAGVACTIYLRMYRLICIIVILLFALWDVNKFKALSNYVTFSSLQAI